MSPWPSDVQVEHDCDPETDSDELNHRFDTVGNVDPVELEVRQ